MLSFQQSRLSPANLEEDAWRQREAEAHRLRGVRAGLGRRGRGRGGGAAGPAGRGRSGRPGTLGPGEGARRRRPRRIGPEGRGNRPHDKPGGKRRGDSTPSGSPPLAATGQPSQTAVPQPPRGPEVRKAAPPGTLGEPSFSGTGNGRRRSGNRRTPEVGSGASGPPGTVVLQRAETGLAAGRHGGAGASVGPGLPGGRAARRGAASGAPGHEPCLTGPW
nr:exosome complex component RRP41 isoform X2 [Delphinus delphis]